MDQVSLDVFKETMRDVLREHRQELFALQTKLDESKQELIETQAELKATKTNLLFGERPKTHLTKESENSPTSDASPKNQKFVKAQYWEVEEVVQQEKREGWIVSQVVPVGQHHNAILIFFTK